MCSLHGAGNLLSEWVDFWLAKEGWAVNRLVVAVLLVCGASTFSQSPPAARLGSPVVRASSPDPFQEGLALPAARIGSIEEAKVGIKANQTLTVPINIVNLFL